MVKNIKRLRFLSSLIMVILTLVISGAYFFGENEAMTVSSNKQEPIFSGSREGNVVALMFNCYEGREVIESIASELERNEFRATFFFGGCFADDNGDLIVRLANSGHEIGNHGYFHKEHGKLSYEKNLQEIKNTYDIILGLSGVSTTLFAPPSGDYNDHTLEACKKLGYKVIMWSIDTIDWRDKNEETVYNRATRSVSGGDFVLMHPKEHTARALPLIVENYISRGLVVGTVSQCME